MQTAFANRLSEIERTYRLALYRRPIGIVAVLFAMSVALFLLGILYAAPGEKYRSPFIELFMSISGLSLVLIAACWFLRSFALATSRKGSALLIGAAALLLAFVGISFQIAGLRILSR